MVLTEVSCVESVMARGRVGASAGAAVEVMIGADDSPAAGIAFG